MEDEEISVILVTYGVGEKYESLTGKRGGKGIPTYCRYLPYITTLVCHCRTSFSVVTGFPLPDGCSSMDGITALSVFFMVTKTLWLRLSLLSE